MLRAFVWEHLIVGLVFIYSAVHCSKQIKPLETIKDKHFSHL